MKLKKLSAYICAAALGFSASALCAKTLTIGIDQSGSNPLLTSQQFADAAAAFTAKKVAELKDGDVIRIHTIGARNSVNNLNVNEAKISRRFRASKAAKAISQHIRAMPSDKTLNQSATNILAWLEFTNGFDCTAHGEIIVITDGLEASSLVDPNKLLDGSVNLPAPERSFANCKIDFFGLGAGLSAISAKTIRDQWITWFEKAGGEFKPVMP